MSTLSYRFHAFWSQVVFLGDRFSERARDCLIEAASWCLDRLRGTDLELVIDERDVEFLTPRTVRRLDRAVSQQAFPRIPLPEAVVRRGWVHMGHATILGLGAPVARDPVVENRRRLEMSPTEPFWLHE